AGDAINLFLFATMPDRLSFLSLAGMAATQPSDLPDIPELARHVASTFGADDFGRPRVPASAGLTELPRVALATTWKHVSQILQSRRAAEWPVFLGTAAYRIARSGGDQLAPAMAQKILLEAAVPMSKLDPTTVQQSGIPRPSFTEWSGRAL